MAWPPPVLPTNRTNANPQQDTHPADHNAVNLAVNDLVVKQTATDSYLTTVAKMYPKQTNQGSPLWGTYNANEPVQNRVFHSSAATNQFGQLSIPLIPALGICVLYASLTIVTNAANWGVYSAIDIRNGLHGGNIIFVIYTPDGNPSGNRTVEHVAFIVGQ